MRLPVSPASISKIPHDQTQGGGRPGVCVPDLREAFREGPQPERAHVYGPPAHSGGHSEGRQSAAAAATVRPAHHLSDRGGGPARPGQVTAGRPSLGSEINGIENSSELLSCSFRLFSLHSGDGLGLGVFYGSTHHTQDPVLSNKATCA